MWKGSSSGAVLEGTGKYYTSIWDLECRAYGVGTWRTHPCGLVEAVYRIVKTEFECAYLSGRTFVVMLRVTEQNLLVVSEREVFSDGRASEHFQPGVGLFFTELLREPDPP